MTPNKIIGSLLAFYEISWSTFNFMKLLTIAVLTPLLLTTFVFQTLAGRTNGENTVVFGLNLPLTGAYSQQGEDQLRAYKLAIGMLNGRGGLLGKKVVYSVRDTRTDGEIARKNAEELIQKGIVMLTGGASSASAIAQAEVCQAHGIPFMAGVTHSNATTGTHGHRHTFRWYNNGHQTAQALAETLIDRNGPNASYGFIYADYTWGQTVQKSLQEVIEKSGGEIVLSLPTKLGAKSYISNLLRAKQADLDVLVLVHFGKDMINCLKQATLLKLREQMAVVVPLMELNMAYPLGPEVMQGVITSMPWYHGLSSKYRGSDAFVKLFELHFAKKPGNAAATAWTNILQYADAVERAKSFDHKKVVRALEGHRFQVLGKDEYWRTWDHQAIRPTYIAIGKSPEQSQNEWDLFQIIAEKDGGDLARTREENPVVLEPLD